jgi:anthranilate phosphoribosyltransferase
LEADEAEAVLDQVLRGAATPAQISAFVVALRAKGESTDEITGLARSMIANGTSIQSDGDVLDVVGTGGDRLGSVNVSTMAALIAAGAGAKVCKHGNRAASSSVGTADVLEALGVAIDLGPSGVLRCLEEVGMGFCFAPRFHPAMRFASNVRREVGVPTVFNILGPLANPARAKYQLVGVNDPGLARHMASVLGATGSRRAWVVHADDGLDELSVTSPSTVVELIASADDTSEISTWRLDPADLGFAPATLHDLRGGLADFNANVIREVLAGTRGPCRDIAVLNAGAALVVAGRAKDISDGVTQASASVDLGKANEVLARLIEVSAEAAAEESATRG